MSPSVESAVDARFPRKRALDHTSNILFTSHRIHLNTRLDNAACGASLRQVQKWRFSSRQRGLHSTRRNVKVKGNPRPDYRAETAISRAQARQALILANPRKSASPDAMGGRGFPRMHTDPPGAGLVHLVSASCIEDLDAGLQVSATPIETCFPRRPGSRV
jgi:hypothetical protein